MAMLGHDVPAYKLAAFTIAALYAGLAGAMLGPFQSYMPPDAFALETSGQLVVQTIVGGVGTSSGRWSARPSGCGCGITSSSCRASAPSGNWCSALAFIGLCDRPAPGHLRRGACISGTAAGRHGGAGRRLPGRRSSRRQALSRPASLPAEIALPMPRPAIDGRSAHGEIALEARGLARHYGGLKAVDGVSFTVRRGSIHAVIGPNGAGKSTLVQDALRRGESERGRGAPVRREADRGRREPRRPAGRGEEQPAQPALPEPHGAGQPAGGGPGPGPGPLPPRLPGARGRPRRGGGAGGHPDRPPRPSASGPTPRRASWPMARSGGWRSAWRSAPARTCCSSTNPWPA